MKSPRNSRVFALSLCALLIPHQAWAGDPVPPAAAGVPAEGAAPIAPAPEGTPAPTEQPTQAAPPAVDPYAEAKERVQRAETLYEAGNYDAALTEFRKAYENMLGHPARPYVLYNIGRCEEKLYRYDAAIASYREYLTLSAADAEDRPTVTATIDLLEGLLGTLKLSVKAKPGASLPSYEVWVDGRLIGENRTQVLIPGGNHRVEIRAAGFETATQEAQIAARSQIELTYELAPLAQEYKGLPKAYFWTAAALTGAAAVTGTAFGLSTLSKKNNIDTLEPEAVTQEDVDSLEQRALMTDIFLISAGVLGTSAAILAFLTDWSEDPPPESVGGLVLKQVAVAPQTSGAFIQVGGTFSW